MLKIQRQNDTQRAYIRRDRTNSKTMPFWIVVVDKAGDRAREVDQS